MNDQFNPTQPTEGSASTGSSAGGSDFPQLEPPVSLQGNAPQSAPVNPDLGAPVPVTPTPVTQSPVSPPPASAPPVSAPRGAEQGAPVTIEDTSPGSAEFNNNYQKFAESAGKQMEEAADALRRGEFVRDAVVDPSADSDDRLVGLLNYVVPVLLPAIVLLSESSAKRPFQRFHAVQSLGLSAAMILVGIALGLVSAILGVIPVINIIVGIALVCLTPILFLMALVAVVYYGVQAYQGKRFVIPGVTSFLINQGWL